MANKFRCSESWVAEVDERTVAVFGRGKMEWVLLKVVLAAGGGVWVRTQSCGGECRAEERV